MIGVNERGFCKVWVSGDFGSNAVKGAGRTEGQMVGEILGVV